MSPQFCCHLKERGNTCEDVGSVST